MSAPVAAHGRRGHQVLVGRQVLEHAAAFQHLGDAQLHALGRRQRVDVLAHEVHLAAGDLAALGLQQPADALQRGALAGAVGTQQRHHAALRHVQRHALDGQRHPVVDDLDVVQGQDGSDMSVCGRPVHFLA
jgi:hypothetical protein